MCFGASVLGATPAVKKNSCVVTVILPISRKLHETAGCRRQQSSGSTRLVFKLAPFPPSKLQMPDRKISQVSRDSSNGQRSTAAYLPTYYLPTYLGTDIAIGQVQVLRQRPSDFRACCFAGLPHCRHYAAHTTALAAPNCPSSTPLKHAWLLATANRQ